MNEDPNRSLFSKGEIVLRRYHALQLTLHELDIKSILQDQALEVAETEDRFVVWASNIGLFNPAHSSLDYRLRDNEQIRAFANSLLEALGHTIQRIDDIASGKRVPFELIDSDEDDDQSPDSHATDTQSDDASSLQSDVDIVIGGITSEADHPDTELSLLQKETASIIGQLSGLTLQIRSPTSRKVPAIHKIDLYRHISPEFKDNFIKIKEEREYNGLVDLFKQWRRESSGVEDDNDNSVEPLTAEDESLIRRFLKANLVRRRRFYYWKRYKFKSLQYTQHVIPQLDQPLNLAPAASVRSAVSQTTDQPTIRQPTLSHQPSSKLSSEMPLPAQFSLKAPASSISSRAATISVKGPDGLVVHWPIPPRHARKSKVDFECPYCFFLCPHRVTKEYAWRDHLRHDLQPYQCTYQQCEEANEMFYDYQTWNMHEQRMHRRTWTCNLGDRSTFTAQALYEEHVRSKHADQASKLLIPELVSSRETTPKIGDRACPMCLKTFPYTHELQMHIARHLEGISLIALPPEEDIESDSERNASIESHVAERRDHLPALSTSNDFPDDLGEPPQFPENEVDPTYVPPATILLTSQALQQIPHRDLQHVQVGGGNDEDDGIRQNTSVLTWVHGIRMSPGEHENVDSNTNVPPRDFNDRRVEDGGISGETGRLAQPIFREPQSHNGGEEGLDEEDFYKRLEALDYSAHQKDLSTRRHERTGGWFLDSSEFQNWQKTNGETLFCPGMLGAGKTFITSLVVDHLCAKYQIDANVAIAYIYLDVSQQYGQDPLDILKSLMQQLMKRRPTLPKVVSDLLKSWVDKMKELTFDMIEEAIYLIMAQCAQSFIVIDGLDEYPTPEFLSHIFILQKRTRLNLFATSRNDVRIIPHFVGNTRLMIAAEEHDIGMYVISRISRMPLIAQDEGLKEAIVTTLIAAAHGSFLFVRLVVDSLILTATREAMLKSLMDLPRDVEGAYNELMTCISSQGDEDRIAAQHTINCIMNGRRPLTLLEIQHGFHVDASNLSLDQMLLFDKDHIISICGGLVRVDKESDVTGFTHTTTFEYFVQHNSHWFPNAQQDMAHSCIDYLSLDDFRRGHCSTDEELRKRLLRYPFYDYAARNWGHHARAHHKELEESILNLLQNEAKLSAASQVMLADGPFNSDWRLSSMTAMHVAAYFGLAQSIRVLEALGYQPNSKGFEGRTPLLWAAKNGHERAVMALLNNRADLEAKDIWGYSPLMRAIEGRHLETAELLLQSGASREVRDSLQRTPLLLAAQIGFDAMVKLLLGYLVDINARNSDGNTALALYVSRSGTEEILELLLRKGADVNSKDMNGDSILIKAIEAENLSAIGLLLENGADADALRGDGSPSLNLAVASQNEAIVELLLEKGANIEAKDTYGQTPLLLAAHHGREQIVKLLLEKGANVEAKDDKGCTALHLAAAEGSPLVVEALLDYGAAPDAEDNTGATPLFRAVVKGKRRTILVLLEQGGADPEYENLDGETPLSIAISRDSDVVELLEAHIRKKP